MTSSLENSHSFEEERMEKGNSETFLIIKVQILGKARSLCGIFFPIPRPVFQLINALNVQQFTTVYHISAQFNTCDDDDVRDSWKFGVITSTSMQEYASVAFFPVFFNDASYAALYLHRSYIKNQKQSYDKSSKIRKFFQVKSILT